MIKLMPNELIGSYDARYTLQTNGRLTAKDCIRVVSSQSYKAALFSKSERWRLFPSDMAGAFIRLFSHSHNKEALIVNHTYIKEAFMRYQGCFSWQALELYLTNYHNNAGGPRKLDPYTANTFKKLYRLVHTKIRYCHFCAKEQVKNFGTMWFSKKKCSVKSHSTTGIIGCANCYLQYLISDEITPRLDKRTKKKPDDFQLLQNRIL